MNKAIPAIENGAAGKAAAFVQTAAAGTLREMVKNRDGMLEGDRQELLAFLAGNPFSQGYASQSGEIVGILKQIHEEMSKELADTIATEDKAIKDYKELIATKKEEVANLTLEIED